MESWWIEQNGALSPLSNVDSPNNIGVPNTINYSRTWMPNSQNHQNFHGSTIYDTVNTFPNGLRTATVDTFIESFTQLTESISTNALYNHASSNNYPCMDNSSTHMSNYRAITQYYNTRRIDINTNISAPFVTNRYVNQTASILNQHFRYFMPSHNTVSNNSTHQQKIATTNFYPNWKNYLKQSVNLPNTIPTKKDVKWLQAVQWNGSPNTNKSLNSFSSEPDTSFKTVDDLSKYDKYVETDEEKRKKDNARKVQEYMDQYYDYINPYCCKFCTILDRVTSKRALELYDQRLLLKKNPINPNELTDGIKMILTWPINEELNNLSNMDGLTAFYLDEHKRKMKDIFPNVDVNGNKRNCINEGCNCRLYAMTLAPSQELRLAATFVPSSEIQNFNDIGKNKDQAIFDQDSHESASLSSSMTDENSHRSIADLVSLGPINNNLYLELLYELWENERPRMTYTHNLGNDTRNSAGGDGEKLLYTCNHFSQEKLQEIFLRRAQMKTRNRLYEM